MFKINNLKIVNEPLFKVLLLLNQMFLLSKERLSKQMLLLKKQTTMTILDNSDCGETYESTYKNACELLKTLFFKHLRNYEHPRHASVAKVKPHIPILKWRTKINHIDSEVFTMIHMESYMGEAASKWDVGLCEESES